jgi:predicted alpha/beta hydrolase family esterase
MSTTLIVPGLQSSGPSHWQSWLEQRTPGSLRVIQRDWTDAHLPDWSSRVRRDITRTPGRIVIAAHSFGALAAIQAASDVSERIIGALLVAPADPDRFGVSDYLPQQPLGFPVVVVASTNDPWMTLERAAHWADLWGGDLVNLGAAGHINSESGFGPWPEGLALLGRLKRASEFRSVEQRWPGLRLSPARRPPRAGGFPGRSATRHRFADEHLHVRQAVALLEEAGWTVNPPLLAHA